MTLTYRALPPTALLRLLQLVSPALPIGGYNFSQGLEYAVEAGWVRDEATALSWVRGLARASLGTLDVPVLYRLHTAWVHEQIERVRWWSGFLIASRETSELRADDRHLGRSLAKVLADYRSHYGWTDKDCERMARNVLSGTARKVFDIAI